MSLVLYPDSDSDDGDGCQNAPARATQNVPKTAVKRKAGDAAQHDLPPLPAAFHDLYSTNARVSTSDNPSLHGGRQRAVPHVEGVWPSHVYLEWIPLQTESEKLHELIQHVRDTIASQNKQHAKKLAVPEIVPSLASDLGAPLPLHVSLSRTLQIRTEDRDAFLETLKSSLRRAAVPPFRFEFRSLKWVPNFERNRWFLVLGIERPSKNELNRLLNACNEAAKRCGHPGLYIGGRGDGPMEEDNDKNDDSKRRKVEHVEDSDADRSERFHISIAWNLDEPAEEWLTLVKSIDVNRYVRQPITTFDVVKARVGNVVHNIDLKSRVVAQGSWTGLLGLT